MKGGHKMIKKEKKKMEKRGKEFSEKTGERAFRPGPI